MHTACSKVDASNYLHGWVILCVWEEGGGGGGKHFVGPDLGPKY